MGGRIVVYSRLVGFVVVAVMAVAIAFGHGLIQDVRIGGPIYGNLIAGKDVIADVLPPPLYIIEPYLEASQAMLDPASAAVRQDRVADLKALYDERRAVWQEATLTPTLKATLLADAHEPADRFFTLAFERFFPALQANDRAAADAAYAEMSAHYATHRAAVDQVVALASTWYAETEAQAKSTIPWALSLLAALAAVIVALVVGTAILAETAVIGPITRVAATMRRLAAGEALGSVPPVGRTAEMRDLAAAMTVFAANARERAGLLDAVEEGRREAEARKGTLEQLAINFLGDADAMKTVLDREAHVVGGCAKAFGQTVNASEVEAQNGLAASITAAETVRAVAAEVGHLSTSTRQVARQTEEARRITKAAADRAAAAERDVQALTTVAGQIKTILEAIGGIASQTNLLSLNATIEASRAGDAGRGFAVVAAEVKALAGETARATAEVDHLLQQINGCTGAVVDSIGRIVSEVESVSALNSEIAAVIAQQEQATAQIAENAEKASHSTDGVRETSARLTEIVRGAGVEVRRVSDASRSLFDVLGTFSKGTDRFLGTISHDMKERRSHVRHQVGDPVEVVIGGRRIATSVKDVSLGGAAVAKVPGVQAGTALALVFDGREISAECIWVGDTHFGVRFRQVQTEFPVLLRKVG